MDYCKDCVEYNSRTGYCNYRGFKCSELDSACNYFDSQGKSSYSSFSNRCGSCKEFDSNANWCNYRKLKCQPNEESCIYYS